MKPWDVEHKWCISQHGWAEEVRKQMPLLPNKVTVRDVTFREADDCVGCRVSVPEKMEMLSLAVEMGVEEIDVGGPSMHKHQYDFCKVVANSGIKVRKTARFFANNTKNFKRDVDICVEAGCDNLRIILMYLHEKTLLEQLAAFPSMIDYIHSQYNNMEVCFGMSDIPRAPMELIRKVYSECVAAGADKAGIFDTFGVANAATMRYLSNEIKVMLPPNMKFMAHCHNTFGLATANTLACVEGGANEVDLVVNGYGDEAGNASFEEVVVALEALYGVTTGLNIKLLKRYSELGLKFGKVPIQPHKAIVGQNAFLRPMYIWAGIDMAKESWFLHEPLNPESVGTKSTIAFGPEGSLDPEPIEKKLKELNLPCTPDDIVRVREAAEAELAKETIVKFPRWYISESDFEDLCRNVMAKESRNLEHVS
jgi:isopropylmalate/homocitrate/citramalate synthase